MWDELAPDALHGAVVAVHNIIFGYVFTTDPAYTACTHFCINLILPIVICAYLYCIIGTSTGSVPRHYLYLTPRTSVLLLLPYPRTQATGHDVVQHAGSGHTRAGGGVASGGDESGVRALAGPGAAAHPDHSRLPEEGRQLGLTSPLQLLMHSYLSTACRLSTTGRHLFRD